jgi:hypothetical protein
MSLFTGVTLLWSSGAAPGGDVGLLFRTCRRGTGAAREQHAVDLPGYVALEATDDLPLALAFRGAPRATYSCVRPSRRIRARQIMYSARLASRLPPRLRRCLTTFPEEASMGATPRRLAKDASLPNLLGLSLRPRSTASQRCRYRCPVKRPAPGRLAQPADRGAPLAPRSPRRGPRGGGPPNGARTWSQTVRREDHLRGGSARPPRRALSWRALANGGAVARVPSRARPAAGWRPLGPRLDRRAAGRP